MMMTTMAMAMMMMMLVDSKAYFVNQSMVEIEVAGRDQKWRQISNFRLKTSDAVFVLCCVVIYQPCTALVRSD